MKNALEIARKRASNISNKTARFSPRSLMSGTPRSSRTRADVCPDAASSNRTRSSVTNTPVLRSPASTCVAVSPGDASTSWAHPSPAVVPYCTSELSHNSTDNMDPFATSSHTARSPLRCSSSSPIRELISDRQMSPDHDSQVVMDPDQPLLIPITTHYDPVVDSMDDEVNTTVSVSSSVIACSDSGSLGGDVICCPICSAEVPDSDDCFECDLCNNWCHISCLSISKDVYDAINAMNRENFSNGVVRDCIKIHCPDCQCIPPLPTTPATNFVSIAATEPSVADCSADEITVISCPDNAGKTPSPVTVKGAGCTMSNLFSHEFTFNGLEFRSAEHAYQYECAIRQGQHTLADGIKRAPTASKAKKLSHQMVKLGSKGDRIELMWDILVQKAAQCDIFVKDLIGTSTSKILHSTGHRDILWGTGLNPNVNVKTTCDFKGENVFGRLLMDLCDVSLGVKDSFAISDYVSTASVSNRRVPDGCSVGADVSRAQATPQLVVKKRRVVQPSARRQSVSQPVVTKQQVSQHKCFHCGVPGHVRRVCRLKSRPVICRSCNSDWTQTKVLS